VPFPHLRSELRHDPMVAPIPPGKTDTRNAMDNGVARELTPTSPSRDSYLVDAVGLWLLARTSPGLALALLS
jgi:hypothetical protein